MKLLIIILMIALSTCLNAAGGEGAVGSPQIQLISVTVIDDNLSLACYQEYHKEETTCVIEAID